MTVGPVTRDAATAEFFDGTSAGQFLMRHCRTCGALSAPQAVQCENCSSTVLDWRLASADATLISWAVAHSKPDASGETSRTILGIAELAEGPWWWSQIVDADPAELRAGAQLRISFQRHDVQHEAVPVFSLAIGERGCAAELSGRLTIPAEPRQQVIADAGPAGSIQV
jgi:hypothetical protein